ACSDEGLCEPGERTRSGDGCAPGEARDVVCGESCAFEPAGECEADGCDSPGAMESAACGRCGSTTRFCTSSGTWEYGVCEEQDDACEPGTVVEEPCGFCGRRELRCGTDCGFAAGECVDEGVCAPGELMTTREGCPSGEERVLRCTEGCGFEEAQRCMPVPVSCTPACADGERCDPDGRCRCGIGPACDDDEVCDGTACIAPSTGCTLAPPFTGCRVGETCDLNAAGEPECYRAGPVSEGGRCSSQDDCGADLSCRDIGGEMVCLRLCAEDDDCTGGPGSVCALVSRDEEENILARTCTLDCDPRTNGGCVFGGCQPFDGVPVDFTHCVPRGTSNFFCSSDAACEPTRGCTTDLLGVTACQSYCRVGTDDCGACEGLPGGVEIGDTEWGVCVGPI
ncbi:MAG: hypothetical protein AAF938_30245, partial [Myxococcota bacterium]